MRLDFREGFFRYVGILMQDGDQVSILNHLDAFDFSSPGSIRTDELGAVSRRPQNLGDAACPAPSHLRRTWLWPVTFSMLSFLKVGFPMIVKSDGVSSAAPFTCRKIFFPLASSA